MTSDPWILAIDFGTSFTVAASRIGDRAPEVIEIDGERRLPSVIMIDDAGEVTVGRAADNLAPTNPGRVLRAPKSRLGEPAPVVLAGRPHSITTLVAELLRHVHREAVRYHGREPDQVRLTHPATWSGPRRQELLGAAEQAGLPDPILVPEPVAAAIAYADDGAVPDGGHVLVYDLGGGTFDTAALQASPDGFVVIGRPAGDPRLGGELFDELLANHIGERLEGDAFERIQLAEDALWQQAAAGLLRESRRVKEALSSHPYADVLLGLPTGMAQQRIEQSDLDRIIGPYIDETVDVMRQTTIGAGLEAADLSSIYLVGGASRTPLVGDAVAAAYPGVEISRRGDPKGVVALGATHPLATPTSLAQRSSLDRASTVERPGPPPPAGPAAAAAAVGAAAEAVDPTPGTVVDTPAATVADTPAATVADAAPVAGTVVESPQTVADTPLPPPADTAPSTATAPRADSAGPTRNQLLVGAGVAGALLIGAIGFASTRGGDDNGGGATPATTVAGQPIAATTVAPPTVVPTTATPVTSPTTLPAATTVPATTPPPSTAAPTTIAPTTVAATTPPTVSATEADLRNALIAPADLPAQAWVEIPFGEGDSYCGEPLGDGSIADADVLYRLDSQTDLQSIGQSSGSYDSIEAADAEFSLSMDLLGDCPNTTIDFDGVVYDMFILTQGLDLGETDDILFCADDSRLLAVSLSNPDAPVPLLVQFTTAIRCGSNITVISFVTDEFVDDAPPDFYSAVGAAMLRFQALPGSR